jgi:hypothetical protein
MKQVSLTLKWPQRKGWILEALEKVVEKKEKLGIKSSVPAEVARILENYMTGIVLGKSLDREVLKKMFENAIPDFKVEENVPEAENPR